MHHPESHLTGHLNKLSLWRTKKWLARSEMCYHAWMKQPVIDNVNHDLSITTKQKQGRGVYHLISESNHNICFTGKDILHNIYPYIQDKNLLKMMPRANLGLVNVNLFSTDCAVTGIIFAMYNENHGQPTMVHSAIYLRTNMLPYTTSH